ncbi:MAG: hypothetical protein ACPGFB_11060 [Verrucomicrobiales bacterium]
MKDIDQQVLEFIREYHRLKGQTPDHHLVNEHFGWNAGSNSTGRNAMRRLEREGYLEYNHQLNNYKLL